MVIKVGENLEQLGMQSLHVIGLAESISGGFPIRRHLHTDFKTAMEIVQFEIGRIGWSAPLARALRGARVGDLRTVRLPAGEKEWEVIAIAYPGD